MDRQVVQSDITYVGYWTGVFMRPAPVFTSSDVDTSNDQNETTFTPLL